MGTPMIDSTSDLESKSQLSLTAGSNALVLTVAAQTNSVSSR